MNGRYRLGGLENDQLLAALSGLVRRENDSLSDVLAHLAELDERGLCLALGYSSLFAYCREALGFCKSSAGRRIAAARVCRKYPEAFERVAKGELQLSVLCALGQYLTSENAAELFAACSRKSYEQVEELLAARFPKADVRDLIRRLPARTAEGAPDIGTSRAAASEASTGAAPTPPRTPEVQQAVPIQPAPREAAQTMPARGAIKPLSEARFSVNFTADSEFRELLEEVRALASHSPASSSLMDLMKLALQALRGELLKKRFGVGRKPRRVRATPQQRQTEERSRQVPAAVAREVYERDGGRCTFCSEDGRRCSARELLQFDHIIPFAKGGESTVANLRLRCRAHNLHAARRHFGIEHMRTTVARARDKRRQQPGQR